MRCPYLIAIVLIEALPAAASHPVRGRAADGDAPIARAAVVLLREGRQQAGATTDDRGRFMLEADTGRYTLLLRHVAYRPLETEVAVPPGGIDLGALRPETAAIREVTVTAPTVTREADRYVLPITDIPVFAGQDGAELLARVPGVRLSDEGISINGAGGTKLFVDGRERKGSAEENARYLRSLTAADIERIEVLPQTGADFAADTRGGAILLTLRRRRSDGLDGSLGAATTQSSLTHAYTPSARLGIRRGRWTLGLSGSALWTPRSDIRFTERREYEGGQPPFTGRSDARSRSRSGRGGLLVLFDPSPRHTLGAEVEYAARNLRVPMHAHTASGTTETVSRYFDRSAGGTLTATANYIWKIDTLGSELKWIADYTRHTADGSGLYRTTTAQADSRRDTLYRSATGSTYDLVTADLSLTRKLRRGLTLRTGLRYTRNDMRDDSRYEARRPGGWQALPTYGYASDYTEQIGAAYVMLGLNAGRWDLSAGLRGEYSSVRSSSVDRSEFGLFPSLRASWALDALRSWLLIAQWSRHIERPSFPALNPARIRLSPFSWQSGNPALRPTYIHRLSLTAVWRYRYTLTLGGNLHRDLIREVTRTDEDDICIRPENHYRENHWFAAASAPLRIARRCNLTLNAVGVVQRIRLARTDAAATHGLLFADATAAFTLPADFFVEAVYRYQSRLYSGNSGVEPRHTVDVTLKKRLCRRRLTLFCTVANLTDCGVGYFSEDAGVRRTMRGHAAWAGRVWKIGASWSFRSGERLGKRTIESAARSQRQRLDAQRK